ncbi:hypothetical protein AB0942_32350 [Streptomyces nodosus]|uniref:hypothetical protein n=1 Tax=Streptomyces nodosus TaxID=40318 RepID=UPI0034571A65
MWNVISTVSSSDVDEEYAEQVDALIEILDRQRAAERETTQVDKYGQTGLSIRLYTYEAPGSGGTRWAVDYNDPAVRELEETDSRDEANARYEELVRDAAGNLGIDGDGYQERFSVTDVDGTPGPLPTLPTVGTSDVETLLDEDGTPVLHLHRTDDDELTLRTGQDDQVDSTHVVLTRAAVLKQLSLTDGETRVTSAVAARTVWEYGMNLSLVAHETRDAVKAAADALFLVAATA